MIIRIKRLREAAVPPTKGSPEAAGVDLRACLEQPVEIRPDETVKIPTGFAMELPSGYAGLIYARSGLATKEGLAPANKVGVIDPDYRGEIIVALHNHSLETRTVIHGERIAQLVVTPFLTCEFEEGDLSETERGAGGFGSTGKS